MSVSCLSVCLCLLANDIVYHLSFIVYCTVFSLECAVKSLWWFKDCRSKCVLCSVQCSFGLSCHVPTAVRSPINGLISPALCFTFYNGFHLKGTFAYMAQYNDIGSGQFGRKWSGRLVKKS